MLSSIGGHDPWRNAQIRHLSRAAIGRKYKPPRALAAVSTGANASPEHWVARHADDGHLSMRVQIASLLQVQC
ncbi:MAG: hypothetical protein KDI80_08985, partial [Xanthomonadales bacterium]|nr:hypothetical protein [Xanthomonadales bacterium]